MGLTVNGISHFGRGGLRGASEPRFVLFTRDDAMVVRRIYRTLRRGGVGRAQARRLIIGILGAGQLSTLVRFPEATS